jgi:hypothetical protein
MTVAAVTPASVAAVVTTDVGLRKSVAATKAHERGIDRKSDTGILLSNV